MVRLTINLRSKYLFFGGSAFTLLMLIFHVNSMMASVILSGLDILLYFTLISICALLYWVPFQFNQEFT